MPDAVTEYVDALESLITRFTKGTRVRLLEKNLTALQFLVLRWASTEAPASMTSLARFLGVRPQSVTPVVDSLVSRGWIRRTRDRADRRQMLIELSAEAKQLIAGYRAAHILRLKRALRRFPARSLADATEALRISEGALTRSLEGARATRTPSKRRAHRRPSRGGD